MIAIKMVRRSKMFLTKDKSPTGQMPIGSSGLVILKTECVSRIDSTCRPESSGCCVSSRVFAFSSGESPKPHSVAVLNMDSTFEIPPSQIYPISLSFFTHSHLSKNIKWRLIWSRNRHFTFLVFFRTEFLLGHPTITIRMSLTTHDVFVFSVFVF